MWVSRAVSPGRLLSDERDSREKRSRQRGLNSRPADYKSAALPTELWRHPPVTLPGFRAFRGWPRVRDPEEGGVDLPRRGNTTSLDHPEDPAAVEPAPDLGARQRPLPSRGARPGVGKGEARRRDPRRWSGRAHPSNVCGTEPSRGISIDCPGRWGLAGERIRQGGPAVIAPPVRACGAAASGATRRPRRWQSRARSIR
jgi:hypothetical protein